MLDRFGQTEHVSIADTVAGTCVLAPDALADFEQLVQLAERVWGNPRNRAYLGTLGAALYRAGRFEAALARLSEAANMPSHKGTGRNSLFLAMAHQRLGHAEEAHKWLDRAVLWIEQAPASGPSLSWTQRAQLTILRGEAEGLLKKTPDSAK
jgi:tetratricopeptide (TPR) repeat protein